HLIGRAGRQTKSAMHAASQNFIGVVADVSITCPCCQVCLHDYASKFGKQATRIENPSRIQLLLQSLVDIAKRRLQRMEYWHVQRARSIAIQGGMPATACHALTQRA